MVVIVMAMSVVMVMMSMIMVAMAVVMMVVVVGMSHVAAIGPYLAVLRIKRNFQSPF